MSKIESYRRQARQLVRWHRERNHSVGARIRILTRYRELTDAAALALRFPLAEAQEIIARENGYDSWAVLKAGLEEAVASEGVAPRSGVPCLKAAIPVVPVSNVQSSAAFFRDKLGFAVDFLHGNPPFYGSVSRDDARIHLRFVHEPAFVAGIVEREQLISAFLQVDDVKGLYAEYLAARVPMHGRLKKEPWGMRAFTVCDPDGNHIYFAG
jgi:catechol 2,3-dioxygenase-like lactoylglutathione lyase family enzyme